MKLVVFRKFCKLMNSTFSDNDGEALNALRAANRILKEEGIDWDRVMNRMVAIDIEAAPEEDRPIKMAQAKTNGGEHARIQDWFDSAYDRDLDVSATHFIDSLFNQWKEKGYLSDKQRDALWKFANPEAYRDNQ